MHYAHVEIIRRGHVGKLRGLRVKPIGCCEATKPHLAGEMSIGSSRAGESHPLASGCDRRTAVKGMLAVAGGLTLSACAPRPEPGSTRVRLAFCGQLLCVIPYEVTR